MKSGRLILFISIFTIIFLAAIAFNVTPYLRGPIDHLVPSRWPYYFVNTVNKVWAPTLVFLLISILYLKIEKSKKMNLKLEWKHLITLVILTFFFQLSLVYFSRFGIKILFRRLVDPGINGYFSTAVKINNTPQFLHTFPQIATHLDQHARDHSPGSVIFIRGIINVFEWISRQTNLFSSLHTLRVRDAKNLWESLTIGQKAANLFLAFFIHFLTSLVIVPFYFLIKKFSKGNSIAAFRGTFLYALIPSFSFFALLFDPIYAIFPMISLILLISTKNSKLEYQNPKQFQNSNDKNIKRFEPSYLKNLNLFRNSDLGFRILFSGMIFGVGLFFSLSILPILLGLTIFTILTFFLKKNKETILKALGFTFGILIVFIVFYLFGFNFLASIPAIIRNQIAREYLPWLIFNPYDFFLYLGIPTSVLFLLMSLKIHFLSFSGGTAKKNRGGVPLSEKNGIENIIKIINKHINLYQINNRVLFTFWLTFLILIISGVSRGEVGRIWQPMMFVPVLFVSDFVTNKLHLNKNQFLLILTLLFLQLIVMEEFWVPIW